MLWSALLWPVKVGVIAAALWYFLRDPLPYPADWITSILAAILLHLAYAACMTGIRRGGDLRLLQRAGEPPADGKRTALVGTVTVTGSPLLAPISGTPCAGYTYEIFHYVRSGRAADNSSTAQRKVTDFSGIALAPCALHTMQGDFPLLSYPFLNGFGERLFSNDAEAARRAGAYVQSTTFERTVPLVGELSALHHAMADTSGSIRKDWRISDASDAGTHLLEQCLPADAKTCAFGIWSDARRTLVADPGHDSRALLLVAGDAAEASARLESGKQSSRSLAIGSFSVAAAVVLFLLFAPWYALRRLPGSFLIVDKQTDRLKDALWADNLPEIARASRYLDPNVPFIEAARTPLMLARSAEAAEILLSRGASVSAHDANGESVLMNAADHGTAGLVRFLTTHGADVNERLQRNAATTALSIARDRDAADIVAALVAAGARQ
jgi:hypothetical protein